MPNTKEIANLFGILSVESRLKILLLLIKKRLCVGALSRELGITPGAVSQHLRLLKHAGLVNDCKCGNFVHYEITQGTMKEALTSTVQLFGYGLEFKLDSLPCKKPEGIVCNKNKNAQNSVNT